jgi:pyruvate dehydrogenase E1 component alpha subunit
MDTIAVYEAMQEAIAHARGGQGPTLLEMKTYRFRGHSMTDPSYYRTHEEEQQWRTKRDPIGIFEKMLLEHGLGTQAEFDENDARATQVSEEAAEFAENSPDPTPEELFSDVMVDDSTALTYRYERT